MTDHIRSRLSIKKELDELSKTSGFRWVALRSQDRTKKCTKCSAETRLKCVSCLGTGFLFIDKLVEGYSYLAVHGREFRSEIGRVSTNTPVYILKDTSKPKEGDLVAELDLDEETGIPRQPFRIRSLFLIQDSKEYRGESGEIEFFRLYTKEQNFDRGIDII